MSPSRSDAGRGMECVGFPFLKLSRVIDELSCCIGDCHAQRMTMCGLKLKTSSLL